MKLFKILSVAAVLCALSFSAVMANASAQKKAGDAYWTVRCGKSATKETKRGNCEITQRLMVKEKNQRFAEMAVSYPKGKTQARGVIILPLGVLLQSGMTMKIDDGKAFKFQARYCDAGGCYAYVDLNEKLLETMRSGKKIVLSFQAQNQKQINVELPLDGFAKALSEIS